MWGAILGFFSWLLGKLFGKPAGPSQEAQEAAKAATATTELAGAQQAVKTETAIANAEVSAPKTKAGVVSELDKGQF